MKAAMRNWLAVVLASSLALGEGVPPAERGASVEPAPAPVPPLPPERAMDLDFSEDFPVPNRTDASSGGGKPADEVTHTLPSAAPLAAPEPARSWIYWTLGFSALAAGGGAWYLHWGARPAPAPVRKDQVFTDDPD